LPSYDARVHRFVLLVLAVLLPLRLLGMDVAMAGAPVTGGPQIAAVVEAVQAEAAAGAHAHAADHAGMPDCHMAAPPGDAGGGPAAGNPCQTCQHCFAWALPVPLAVVTGPAALPGAPTHRAIAFRSADLRPEHRPPIG
jgi:hypothetical protein